MSDNSDLLLAMAKLIHDGWAEEAFDPKDYPEDIESARRILENFDVTPRSTEPVPPKLLMAHDATLRDWFAGQALLGALAALLDPREMTPNDFAEMSFKIADAMLAARSETP